MFLLTNYNLVLLISFSYLCGSIPFGLVVSRSFGIKDLRLSGSGNIGATNAWRVGGRKVGLATFFFDFVKSVIPAATFYYALGVNEAALAGLITMIGHVFPIWLRFKGGKGVACMFGLLLVVTPYIFLISAVVWLVSFKLWRIASVSSLLTALAVFTFSLLTKNIVLVILYGILLLMVFFTHRANILRIIRKTEKPIYLEQNKAQETPDVTA